MIVQDDGNGSQKLSNNHRGFDLKNKDVQIMKTSFIPAFFFVVFALITLVGTASAETKIVKLEGVRTHVAPKLDCRVEVFLRGSEDSLGVYTLRAARTYIRDLDREGHDVDFVYDARCRLTEDDLTVQVTTN